jgi:hypothetical protein
MMDKLLSRTEFQALVVGILLVVFNRKLGLDLGPEELYALVGMIGSYAGSRGLAKMGSPSPEQVADAEKAAEVVEKVVDAVDGDA